MVRKANGVAGDPATSPEAAAPAAVARSEDIAVTMPIEKILQARRELEEQSDEARLRAGVRVTGPAAGRRRAGFAFDAGSTAFALCDLSEEQLRAIDADPLLTMALVQFGLADDLPEGGAEGSGGR